MSAVLHRFQFSTTTTYVLELTDLWMRFYANGQQILNPSGDPYEIATPYDESDLYDLQLDQVGDVIRIVHPDYPPHSLSRIADDDWELEEIAFNTPPFLDENITATTITPSGITGSISLTASTDIFLSGHVGSRWRIGHLRSAGRIEFDITGNGNSSTLEVLGTYNVRTYGNWGADLLVQRSTDGGTNWETVANFHAFMNSGGQGSRSVDAEATAAENALYRLRIENFDSATEAKAILENFDAVVYGVVEITAVGSGQDADATVVTELHAATATDLWSEGAWSEERGYPRTVVVHEQRMVYGGTDYLPSTIWGSVVDDFDNFLTGDGDDLSYAHTLAGKELNAIQWLASQTVLLLGTTGSEWRVYGDTQGGIITAGRIDAKQQSYHGSEYMAAVNTGDAVLFMERKGRHIRELAFVLEADKWVANDLMLFAEHLTDESTGRILQMAWQPDARILWCVTEDGRLLGLTYDRQQQVIGWHIHSTDGLFKSVATIYGDVDGQDEVWVVVARTLGSETLEYVERFYPLPWEDKEDGFFVDSALAYSGSPFNQFAGLSHLAGESIDILADGVVYLDVEVEAGGTFALPSGVTASTVRAGLRYESVLSPFRFDADTQLGVHATKTKIVNSLALRLLRSCMPQYLQDGTERQGVEPEGMGTIDPGDPPLLGASEAVDVDVDFNSGHATNPTVTIKEHRPLPLTVLAMVAGYDVSSG